MVVEWASTAMEYHSSVQSDDRTSGGGNVPSKPGRSPQVLVLLLLVVCGYFGFQLARGQVLYPHTNAPEVGAGDARQSTEDLWRDDVATLYVPETAAHLRADHDGWLATWTPHNGLGRPLFHIGGSPAYIVSHVIARFTGDAFLHYTLMTILSVIGTALFGFLFLRSRMLSPTAAFVGALGLSLGPLYPAWDMIPLVQWGFCWTLAALFGMERWVSRRSAWSLIGMTFAFHSILLTGFLQHVSALAWIAAGWTALRIFEQRGARWLAAAGVLAAAILGLLSVAPVYLDLYDEWARSTRAIEPQTYDPAVYVDLLWPGLFCALKAGATGQVGLSFGPLFCVLALVAIVGGRWQHGRGLRAWYWALFAGLFTVATGSERFYGLLIRLGFGVSAWPPIFAVHLPVAILAAIGVDVLLQRTTGRQRALHLSVVAAMLAVGFGADALQRSSDGQPVDALRATSAGLLGLGALVAAAWPRRAPLLGLASLAAVMAVQTVVVWTPRASIHDGSALATALRSRTADGSRSVWVGPRGKGRRWMPPNVDALLGTRSLHTYDHLPTVAFHSWMLPLRAPEKQLPYIRGFRGIHRPKAMTEEHLAFSGVHTFLSRVAFRGTRPVDVDAPAGVLISEPLAPGPVQALVPLAAATLSPDGGYSIGLGALRAASSEIETNRELTNRLVFDFEPGPEERLLFVSQEHHPHWSAEAESTGLESVRINGLYQGVRVPAGTQRVVMEFRPRAPWILGSQIAFLLAAFAWGASLVRRRFAR